MAALRQTRLQTFLAVKNNEEVARLPHREQQVLGAMFEQTLIAEVPADYWLTKEWGMKLIAWCSLLGLTQVPDELEEAFIVEALQNDYSNHSFAEIEVALKMCVMDEYSEQVEAFNKLNLRFLAKVMKHYRKYRKDVANRYEEIKFRLIKPQPRIPTQYELDISIVQEIWDDLYRKSNDIDVFVVSYKAEFLQKIGVFTSEEIEKEAGVIADHIRSQNPEVQNKENRRRLEQLQGDPERLLIHSTNQAKSNIYNQWLADNVAKNITGEQYAELVANKVHSLHSKNSSSE